MNVEITRGDTFVMECYRHEDDVPVDLTGYTISSTIKSKSVSTAFAFNFTFAVVDLAGGRCRFSATATETFIFPVEEMLCDVKYAIGGVVDHTKKIPIVMLDSVTP